LARLRANHPSAAEPPPNIRFPDPPQLRPPLISLHRVSTGYVSGKPVLSKLDLRLDPDERVALIGANGNGKTTLARLLAGRIELWHATTAQFFEAIAPVLPLPPKIRA